MTYLDPDERPKSVEPAISPSWRRAVFGGLLVVLGVELMLERLIGTDLDIFFPLAFGVAILLTWVLNRRYAWLVAGCVITAWGAGEFLESVSGGLLDSFWGPAGMTAGFLALFAQDRRRSSWALIPAALFGLGAVGALGWELAGTVGGFASAGVLPLMLIAAGALLLFRGAIPAPARKSCLMLVGVLFLVSAFASAGRGFRHERIVKTLPLTETQRVVVKASSGNIDIRSGTSDAAVLSHRGNGVDVIRSETALTIRTSSTDLVLRVPNGTDVEVTTSSGDVDLELDYDPDINVTTSSGDIEVEGDDVDGESYSSKGRDVSNLEIETSSGDVEVDTRRAA